MGIASVVRCAGGAASDLEIRACGFGATARGAGSGFIAVAA
jgi:hypothetical protein